MKFKINIKFFNFSKLSKYFIIANKKNFIELINKNLHNFKSSKFIKKGRYKLFDNYISSTKSEQ